MLDAIAGEHFEAAVVELHRDVDRDLARGSAENLAHAVVQPELLGRVVEAGFGRDPWIRFLVAGQYRPIGVLPRSVCLQRRFQNRFERLLDLRIGLRFHFVALLHAEREIVDLRLQTPLDEIPVLDPLAQRGLNLALRKPRLELIENLAASRPSRP